MKLPTDSFSVTALGSGNLRKWRECMWQQESHSSFLNVSCVTAIVHTKRFSALNWKSLFSVSPTWPPFMETLPASLFALSVSGHLRWPKCTLHIRIYFQVALVEPEWDRSLCFTTDLCSVVFLRNHSGHTVCCLSLSSADLNTDKQQVLMDLL